jgi:hypothetical protein
MTPWPRSTAVHFSPASSSRRCPQNAARARADRVAAGQVEPTGVGLHDGNLAGGRDWIVTRANDRRMSTHGGRDWVKTATPGASSTATPTGR